MVAISEDVTKSREDGGNGQTPEIGNPPQFLLMPPKEEREIVGPGKPPVKYRWKKGMSGNPMGKGRVPSEIRDLARVYTHEAIGRLVNWMRQDKDERLAFESVKLLLERGWGKAPQLVGVVNATEKPTVFTITIDGEGAPKDGGRSEG